ncbi:MAG: hypothetical protein FWG74_09545 [Planctomycetes bacterium]|nr:hypothetical protein [Planctomycetota bacterium]
MRSPELSFLWLAAGPCSRSWSARGFDAGVVDRLRRDGVLRQAEAPDMVACPSCRHTPATVEIIHQPREDGTMRMFGVCPECGAVDLAPCDLLRYAVDYGAVAGFLSAGLGIDHSPEARKPGRCWKLGQARIGRTVRHTWACREEIDGDEDFPHGGVVFTLGAVRGDSWPEGVLRIPAESVFYWKDGLAFDRAASDAYAEPPALAPATKKPASADGKRAGRLKLIDGLVHELERHIIDARDGFYTAKAENRKWRLPDPPTRKWLAHQFNVSEATLSRALDDDAGKRAKALLENCAHEKFVLNFKGKSGKKSGHAIGQSRIV